MIIIDRIEENVAVCETDEGQLRLDLAGLPDVREGDVLTEKDGSWQVDADETARRREQIRRRMSRRVRRPKDTG
ncbi:MAG: DUF3006 domain-containing protein [Oscillospiraceae bacterium]|nr:DUF3006 domain-containing protein [Oscillospiraceae bacterium]